MFLDQTCTKMSPDQRKKPPVILCIGMAGSGKTTFMQRIYSHIHTNKQTPYTINLDPAVHHLPFKPNIDIRDTINYKDAMKRYHLGPNGGILTSLNLFTTKFDQVLSLLFNRSSELDFIIIDTPGQIEIFTWSASGTIITETLASSFPTILAYIIDIPRSKNPATFMSNMLYACSILYKLKLPFILVFNKIDVEDCEFAEEWMRDFEAFQKALLDDQSYMASLMTSMNLVLEEFYSHLKFAAVSSVTGQGMSDFFKVLDECVEEYYTDYLPELERLKKNQQEQSLQSQRDQLTKLLDDLKVSSGNEVDLEKQSESHK